MIGVKRNSNGTGGSTGITKVTLREDKVPGFIPNIDDVQTLLNNYSLTVAPGEVVFLIVAHYLNNTDGLTNFARLVFKNNHLETVFSPANPIQAGDLIYINERYTLDQILNLPGTQLVELGELGLNEAWDVLNAMDPAINLQDDAQGPRIFSAEIEGHPVYYYFLGEAGLYGVGEQQSEESDFIELAQIINNSDWAFDGTHLRTVDFVDVKILANLLIEHSIKAQQYLLDKTDPLSRITDMGGTVQLKMLADYIFGICGGVIKYDANRSGMYDNRTLVDKEYCDGQNKQFVLLISSQNNGGFQDTTEKKNTIGVAFTFTRVAQGVFECPEFDPERHALSFAGDPLVKVSFSYSDYKDTGSKYIITYLGGASSDNAFENSGMLIITEYA